MPTRGRSWYRLDLRGLTPLWLTDRASDGERELEWRAGLSAVVDAVESRGVNLADVWRLLIESSRAVGMSLDRHQQWERIKAALATGVIVVVEEQSIIEDRRAPTPSDRRRSPISPRPAPLPPPPLPPQPQEPEVHHLRRIELGYLTYRPGQIGLFPSTDLDHSPWAALITAARHIAAHPGDRAVLAFHQTADEPSETSELRRRALLAFIRDDRDTWVQLQAEHGSIADTQRLLAYLDTTKAWPTQVVITAKPDAQTKAAVLAFQRAYNNAYNDSIHEDGIVGMQTIAAQFSVLKDELTRWFAINDADFAQLYHISPSAYLACGSRFVGISHDSIGAFANDARIVDLLFVPAGESIHPELQPPGVGVYLETVEFEHLRVADILVPRTHMLIVRLIDHRGLPLAGIDYELRVGDDHRLGSTNRLGEIAEPEVGDGIPIVRLLDGRVLVFHDLHEQAVFASPPPDPPSSPLVPADDDLELPESELGAEERLNENMAEVEAP